MEDDGTENSGGSIRLVPEERERNLIEERQVGRKRALPS